MPVKKPCKICSKPVRINQKFMFCTVCNTWLHQKCTNMTLNEHLNLIEEMYICPMCELADCFTSESEDEPSETDISDNMQNSSSSPPDLPAETACDHELRLRGLDFDSLPVTVNTTNSVTSNTQPGCDMLDTQLVRTINLKYPCVVCNKSCTNMQRSVCCNVCDEWTHTKCTRLSNEEFDVNSSTEKPSIV